MPLLSVSAHDIDAAGLALDAELPAGWLEAELSDASISADDTGAPGHVHARLSRSGDDIVVRGRVRATFTVPCARCTQPAAVEVDTELSLLLQPAPKAPPVGKGKKGNGKTDEEYEFSAAEADCDTYDGETVELDPFVREALLLEVPNFPLCSEGCPGIRPAEEHALEEAAPRIDPRLAPLADLKRALRAGPEAAAEPTEAPAPHAPKPARPARPPTKKNKE